MTSGTLKLKTKKFMFSTSKLSSNQLCIVCDTRGYGGGEFCRREEEVYLFEIEDSVTRYQLSTIETKKGLLHVLFDVCKIERWIHSHGDDGG